MDNVLDSNDLIRQLAALLDFATDRAWEYAQRVGWDLAYPLFDQHIVEPLTRESIRKTYEVLVQKMYAHLQAHLMTAELNPGDTVILWDTYADFIGATVLTADRNPAFKLGLLW